MQERPINFVNIDDTTLEVYCQYVSRVIQHCLYLLIWFLYHAKIFRKVSKLGNNIWPQINPCSLHNITELIVDIFVCIEVKILHGFDPFYFMESNDGPSCLIKWN